MRIIVGKWLTVARLRNVQIKEPYWELRIRALTCQPRIAEWACRSQMVAGLLVVTRSTELRTTRWGEARGTCIRIHGLFSELMLRMLHGRQPALANPVPVTSLQARGHKVVRWHTNHSCSCSCRHTMRKGKFITSRYSTGVATIARLVCSCSHSSTRCQQVERVHTPRGRRYSQLGTPAAIAIPGEQTRADSQKMRGLRL